MSLSGRKKKISLWSLYLFLFLGCKKPLSSSFIQETLVTLSTTFVDSTFFCLADPVVSSQVDHLSSSSSSSQSNTTSIDVLCLCHSLGKVLSLKPKQVFFVYFM